MEPITYSLRVDQPRSDRYYRDVAAFTDEVLTRAEASVGPLVTAFQEAGYEAPRTRAEYIFELMALGVLWRVYADRALRLGRSPRRVMRTLAHWRGRGGMIKPAIDALRGALATLFLARNGDSPVAPGVPSPTDLQNLLGWLDAAGDFEQEVERLRLWQAFFAGRSPGELAATTALADWFAARSLDALGCYTAHVGPFLEEKHPQYRWREDMIFCGRQRVEYHLYMVGTEIMNRAFRADFLATATKLVLLPPCMRARPEGECQARETPFGAQCAACTPHCRVHQITRLGEKHGFTVLMLPQELAALSPTAEAHASLTRMGIVGVSCALTNAQGGWKTQKYAIPAQGLLLDYCGCSWHWHLEGGIPTDINFRQLLRLLEIEKTPAPEKQPGPV